MTDDTSKKNPYLELGELHSSPETEAFFYAKHSDACVDVQDDEGGDAGGITLSVEQLSAYLQAAFNKERRQRTDGQKKFAVCPLSGDPNSYLGKKNSQACGFGESLQIHPLLSQSQQFSGDDPTISANPMYDDSDKARERFLEKRLEHQLRLQKNLGLGVSKSVTLAR